MFRGAEAVHPERVEEKLADTYEERKPAEMERLLALTQSVRGFPLLPLLRADALGRDLLWLFGEAAAGRLTVTQGGRWPLEGVADAHRAIETRRSSGKVVLVP
mgnify:CR=1 FL=1